MLRKRADVGAFVRCLQWDDATHVHVDAVAMQAWRLGSILFSLGRRDEHRELVFT